MQDLVQIQRLLNDYQQNDQIQQLVQTQNPGIQVTHFKRPLTLEDVLNFVNEDPAMVRRILKKHQEKSISIRQGWSA